VFAADRAGSPPGEVVRFKVNACDDRDASPVIVCVPRRGAPFPPERRSSPARPRTLRGTSRPASSRSRSNAAST